MNTLLNIKKFKLIIEKKIDYLVAQLYNSTMQLNNNLRKK